MIIGKHLRFGYGDISIGCNKASCSVEFYQIKDAKLECGDIVYSDEVTQVEPPVVLSFQDSEDYLHFQALLTRVCAGDLKWFKFHGLIFDFSNYNDKSVSVCQTKAMHAMYPYLIALAC